MVALFKMYGVRTADGNNDWIKEIAVKQSDLCPETVPPVGKLVRVGSKVAAAKQNTDQGRRITGKAILSL